MKRKKSANYQECLTASLKKPKEAAAYLDAVLEDGDPKLLLLALKNLAEAEGGMTKVAIRYPQHRFTMVESDRKKSIFLQHVASLLGLKNVRVLNERSGKVSLDPAYAATADVVTSRAVKREDVFAAAASLLKPAGRVIIHHTPDAPAEFGHYRLSAKNPSADCFTRPVSA